MRIFNIWLKDSLSKIIDRYRLDRCLLFEMNKMLAKNCNIFNCHIFSNKHSIKQYLLPLTLSCLLSDLTMILSKLLPTNEYQVPQLIGELYYEKI